MKNDNTLKFITAWDKDNKINERLTEDVYIEYLLYCSHSRTKAVSRKNFAELVYKQGYQLGHQKIERRRIKKMNNVCLVGRLVRDPELRFTAGGLAISRFTLAVDRKMSKEKKMEAEAKNQPTADFISCTAFGGTAETIANYTRKGLKIGVEGRIQTGSYEKDGQRYYTTDVVVNTFEYLENKQNNLNSNEGAGIPANNENIPPEGFFQVNNEDIPF